MSFLSKIDRALVIGISSYPGNDELPDAVANDAREVASFIKARWRRQAGTRTRVLLNEGAVHDEIIEGLRWLASTSQTNETVVFFFSGHGARVDVGTRPTSYLLPVDFDPRSSPAKAINSKVLTNWFRKIKSQALVVILDACHAGGAGELKLVGYPKDPKRGFAARSLTIAKGRAIVASCNEDEYSAVDARDGNSLFTRHLLDGLRGEAAPKDATQISLHNLCDYVMRMVPAQNPKQTPTVKIPNAVGNILLAAQPAVPIMLRRRINSRAPTAGLKSLVTFPVPGNLPIVLQVAEQGGHVDVSMPSSNSWRLFDSPSLKKATLIRSATLNRTERRLYASSVGGPTAEIVLWIDGKRVKGTIGML